MNKEYIFLASRQHSKSQNVFEMMAHEYNDLKIENEELQQRIDKAIKYNEELCELYDCGMELSNAQTNLLILKGDNNE